MLLRVLDFLHITTTHLVFAVTMIVVGFVIGVSYTMTTVEENLAHWGWQEIPAQCEPMNYTPVK